MKREVAEINMNLYCKFVLLFVLTKISEQHVCLVSRNGVENQTILVTDTASYKYDHKNISDKFEPQQRILEIVDTATKNLSTIVLNQQSFDNGSFLFEKENTSKLVVASNLKAALKAQHLFNLTSKSLNFRSQILTPHIICNQDDDATSTKLKISKGKKTSVVTKVLKLIAQPHGGTCTCSPDKGLEAVTNFVIDCRNFESTNKTLYYRVEAWCLVKKTYMPAISKTYNSRINLRLPYCNLITIYICDNFDSCTTVQQRVQVEALKVKKSVEDFKKYFSGIGTDTNIDHYLKLSYWQVSFIIAHAAAKASDNSIYIKIIFDHLLNQMFTNSDQLEQYIYLIHMVVMQVQSLTHVDCQQLIPIFEKVNEAAAHIRRTEDIITTHQFNSTYFYYITMLKKLIKSREKLAKAMCHPEDVICNKERNGYELYDNLENFDSYVTEKLEQWLLLTLAFAHNLFSIGSLSISKLMRFDNCKSQLASRVDENYIYCRFFCINKSNSVFIITPDEKLIKVFISMALFKELSKILQSENIILEILFERGNENEYWWNPTPVPAYNSVIYLFFYSDKIKDKFYVYDLANSIEFATNITRSYHVDENDWVIRGSLNSYMQLKIYTTTVLPNAVLSLNNIKADGSIIVYIKFEKVPTEKEIKLRGCKFGNNSISQKMIMNNHCRKKRIAYISVLSNMDQKLQNYKQSANKKAKRATEKQYNITEFSFIPEIYACTAWENRSKISAWTTKNCITYLNDTITNSVFYCSCNALGAFSPHIYRTFAVMINDVTPDEEIVFDIYLVIFYILLLLIAFITLFRGVSDIHKLQNKNLIDCNFIINNAEEIVSEDDCVIAVRTGGSENAGTSSNIIFRFRKPHTGVEVSYRVEQDPEHPRFTRNTTCTLNLGNNTIALPTYLKIELEPRGRYPSWYCRDISIYDFKMNQSQTFVIRRWIHGDENHYFRSPYYSHGDERPQAYNKWQRIRNHLEENFINWFMFQPILGPWLHGSNINAMNRFERSCVFICKTAITLTVIVYEFGKSSLENEDSKTRTINLGNICYLSFVSYLFNILVDIIFVWFIMRIILKRY